MHKGINHPKNPEDNLIIASPAYDYDMMRTEEIRGLIVDLFYNWQSDSLIEFMSDLERAIVMSVLTRFKGNQKEAAKFLRINYTTFHQKVRKHKIIIEKKPVVQ